VPVRFWGVPPCGKSLFGGALRHRCWLSNIANSLESYRVSWVRLVADIYDYKASVGFGQFLEF